MLHLTGTQWTPPLLFDSFQYRHTIVVIVISQKSPALRRTRTQIIFRKISRQTFLFIEQTDILIELFPRRTQQLTQFKIGSGILRQRIKTVLIFTAIEFNLNFLFGCKSVL
jgi:hypothetical protein